MLTVTPIPAYSDNYIWAIRHSARDTVYIVDPGDSEPVEHYLREQSVELAGILVTHRHWDHVTGIAPLVAAYAVEVIGPACEEIPQVTQSVGEGNAFQLWQDVRVDVMETPGHMPEHISYFCRDDDSAWLFCGDTLFSAGCGRIFSGSLQALKFSLDRLKQLPSHTRVCCAHEYTLANLEFARAVEGNTPAIRERLAEVEARRKNNQPSLPSTIGAELRFNPFLRCNESGVIAGAEKQAGRRLNGEQDVFGVIREWKNTF